MYKKLIIPFTIIIIILTLKISSVINKEEYFNKVKDIVTEEIDFISMSKKFFGKFQFVYFKDLDFTVSSDDTYTKLDDNYYLINTNTNELVNKSEGIVFFIKKDNDTYTLKIRSEDMIITYYDLKEVSVRMYQLVREDVLGKIDYTYRVKYENTN